jgi:Domain of unknown function (DUF4397)
MRVLRKLARLATITVLLGGTAAIAAAASPAASAAPAASQDAWVRIAHLSPKAPAMDMYLYPFGEPGHPIVLRDVSYGDVSAYMAVSPGQYSVAMRGFGAPASSPPALITSFMVTVGTPYTVAALGPDPGLRVEVLKDQMATPTGKALIRVVQASLREHLVTVSYGPDVLARQLAFGLATSYMAVSPGAQTVQFTASGEHAATSVKLAADTVHTIVVLDDSSGLKVDALVDAAGSQIMPKGGAAAGFGGTAPRLPSDPAPWLLTIAAGVLLTSAGLVGLLRSRRVRGLTSQRTSVAALSLMVVIK